MSGSSSVAEALLPPRDDAEVRRIGRELLDHGLGQGASYFDPARAAWSQERVDALYAHYNERLDLGKDPFFVKLSRQLDGAPDDAVLLVAELLTLNMLPLTNLTPARKREYAAKVLGWMQHRVDLPVVVDAAFEQSTWNGGTGAHTMRWKWLLDAVELLRSWWRLAADDRRAALDDPWRWRDVVRQLGGIPSLTEALLYLRFPTHFLPIVNIAHKRAIRQAFESRLPQGTTDDLDRDLFQIALSLQREHGGAVDLYTSPYVDDWRPATDSGERRAWLVRPAPGEAALVDRWRGEGFVSVPGAHLAGLRPGTDRAVVRAAVEEGYQNLDYAARVALTNEYHAFLSLMKANDLVATVSNDQLSAGVVTGDAQQREDGRPQVVRAVDWVATAPVPVDTLPAPVPAEIDRPGTVVDITNAIDALAELAEASSDESDGAPEPPDGPERAVPRLAAVAAALATQWHLDRVWLQRLVDLLQARQQVVLYGPPGTGKTYLAQRLARHVAERDAIELVQFHPSYSYEDFIEGFRPAETRDGSPGFELRAGPLRLLVSRARARPGQPHVLIVDEINRAHLAKVFGELYFLLEYRDESIRLQYSPSEPFWLPPNVFIIGTMNTADRSIALLDAAIRRRFAFVELHPDEPPVRDLLERWLVANHADGDQRAALLRTLNEAIPEEDRDLRIGPSYLMRPEADSPDGLERIWQHDLLPLLEEHYHGRKTRAEVHEQFGLGTIRSLLPAASA